MDITERIKEELERRQECDPLFKARVKGAIDLVDTGFWNGTKRRLSEDEKDIGIIIAGTALILSEIPNFLMYIRS